MKKFLLACSGAFLLAAACGQSGPGGSSPGSGGSSGGTSSGAAGADSPGTGGSNTGAAGTVGSGGNSNPGTAGSNPGSAGNTNPGTAGDGNQGTAGNGNQGSAGNGNQGSAGNGSQGTAGSSGTTGTGGRGGTTGAGGTAGSGTGTGGRGGTTGAGGTAGTGTGTGGRGGTTGTGGSGTGGTGDLMSVAAGLDGYYWEGTCSGNVTASGRNCPFYASGVTTCAAGTSWDNRGTITNKTLKMNGTPGVAYTVNLTIRGVVGTRCYTGGTAPTGSVAAGGTPSATAANSTWYVGGKQYNDSIWNTYEIHVSPSVAGQANVFYANAFGTDAVNTSWCQKEATYQVGYTTKLPVMGDSTLTFTIHDTNCQAQQNCGGNDTSTVCDMMRTVSLSDLTPPGTFAQPPTNSVAGKTYYPQWLYFDVTSVTSP